MAENYSEGADTWADDDQGHLQPDGNDWNQGSPEAPAATQPVEKTFEDVFREAYVGFAHFASLRNDPDHEFVENPDLISVSLPFAQEFLRRTGQDVGLFPLTASSYSCNDLYDLCCEHGISTTRRTSQLGTVLKTIQTLAGLAKTFLSADDRRPVDQMTTVQLGHVDGEGKSSISSSFKTTFEPNSEDKAFFGSNPGVFFIATTVIELVSGQSKQWVKDILTNVTNILSITAKQLLGAVVRVQFVDTSPTALKILFSGSDVDDITRENLSWFIELFTESFLPLGFRTNWRWNVTFQEILSIPIDELLKTQVSLSLPALGIRSQFFELLPAIIPFGMLGLESIEAAYEQIPGLKDITEGNLNTTIDLTTFVSGFVGGLIGGTDQSLNSLILKWAPLILPAFGKKLQHDLTLVDVISALKSVVSLGRLVFGRDLDNFSAFSLTCSTGHSLSFESRNVFRVEPFFLALDTLFDELHTVALEMKNRPAKQ